MTHVLSRLADTASARPRRIVLVALVACGAAGVFGSSIASRLDPYGAEDPSSESVRADAMIERAALSANCESSLHSASAPRLAPAPALVPDVAPAILRRK
jgi:hypothetical protein